MAPENWNTIVVDSATSNLMQTPFLMQEDDDVVTGLVDHKGRAAVRSKHGRWRSAAFIIGVEMAERIAHFGVGSNLINYMTSKLGESTAVAAANVNAWNGVSLLFPILAAVLADSFLGKYTTILASSFLYILGLILLTLSAMLPSFSCLNSESSINDKGECSSYLQIIIFFAGLYMVAVGQGGHKPCVQAFGADQFDGDDPTECKAKSSFFNWWYVGLWTGGLIGIGVLSYIQDNLSWGLGFGIPSIIMVIALLIFVFGTSTYRYMRKSEGHSPVFRIGRVFVLATRNWHVPGTVFDDIEKSHNIQPHRSQQFRFLDKALIVPYNSKLTGTACIKSEVEEAKALLRLFPIWASTLIFAIVFSQTSTFFTKQGVTLDRSIVYSFSIPAAALQSFIGICVVTFLPIYDRVLVPVARNWTGKPAGISMLQRIGTGIFISIICMIVAAFIEEKRLKTALQHGLIDLPNVTVPMSIWWLLPQYVIFGVAEAFTIVGLQELFYDQVPSELRSVGMSLYLSIFGIGSILSSILVSLIDKATSEGGSKPSWFSDNLNRGHLDYFYLFLAGISTIGLALFICFSRSFIYSKNMVPV